MGGIFLVAAENLGIALVAVGIAWLIWSPIPRTILRETFLNPWLRTKIERDEQGQIHVQNIARPIAGHGGAPG